MAGALAQNRGEAVVMGIFVILNTPYGSKELIGSAIVDVFICRRLGLVVVEVAIQMNGVRAEILQLGAGTSP